MDSSRLTDQQIAKLQRIIARQLRFLNWLQRRMEHLRFPPQDRLLFFTLRAHDAVHAMNVELHYLGVKSGVCR